MINPIGLKPVFAKSSVGGYSPKLYSPVLRPTLSSVRFQGDVVQIRETPMVAKETDCLSAQELARLTSWLNQSYQSLPDAEFISDNRIFLYGFKAPFKLDLFSKEHFEKVDRLGPKNNPQSLPSDIIPILKKLAQKHCHQYENKPKWIKPKQLDFVIFRYVINPHKKGQGLRWHNDSPADNLTSIFTVQQKNLNPNKGYKLEYRPANEFSADDFNSPKYSVISNKPATQIINQPNQMVHLQNNTDTQRHKHRLTPFANKSAQPATRDVIVILG